MARRGRRQRSDRRESERFEWLEVIIEVLAYAPRLIFGFFRMILKLLN